MNAPPPEDAEQVPVRRIKLTPASAITPEPVIWAWEPEPGQGRIPAGALTLAAGREGTGKSSFGIWLAARLSRGQLPGTFYGSRRAVFYAAVEDSWSRTLVPRLIAAGADLAHVFRVDVEDALRGETMVSLPADVDLIAAAIAEHQAAALIVDPLMSTLHQGTDAHRTQDVRRALEPLVRMAEHTRALTLGIAHFSKAAGTDASQLITGSGAFKDLARAILAFARDKDDGGQVMTQTKNSLGRLDLPSLGYQIEAAPVATPTGTADVGRLEWTGVSERSVEDTLAAPPNAEDSGERSEAAKWLVSYLDAHGGQAPRTEIMTAAEKLRFSASTITRARMKARVTTTPRQGFGGGTLWVSPNAPHSDPSQFSQTTPPGADPTDPTDNRVTPLDTRKSPSVTAATARCDACNEPMPLIEPGQTTHPACDTAAA